MTAPGDRYELRPLAASLGIRLGGPNEVPEGEGYVALAHSMGVSHGYARVLAGRGLSDKQADRFAIRAGLHPEVVWPGWLETGADDED
jgi:hypothetical protein